MYIIFVFKKLSINFTHLVCNKNVGEKKQTNVVNRVFRFFSYKYIIVFKKYFNVCTH